MSDLKQVAQLTEVEAEPPIKATEEIARWEDEGGALPPYEDFSLPARRLLSPPVEPGRAITGAQINGLLPPQLVQP